MHSDFLSCLYVITIWQTNASSLIMNATGKSNTCLETQDTRLIAPDFLTQNLLSIIPIHILWWHPAVQVWMSCCIFHPKYVVWYNNNPICSKDNLLCGKSYKKHDMLWPLTQIRKLSNCFIHNDGSISVRVLQKVTFWRLWFKIQILASFQFQCID